MDPTETNSSLDSKNVCNKLLYIKIIRLANGVGLSDCHIWMKQKTWCLIKLIFLQCLFPEQTVKSKYRSLDPT